ncbi:MAG: hypothetical protein EXS24_05920 [Pedosphaera sp.]|nr:hypothetical protein [Pedosphaera sp.]
MREVSLNTTGQAQGSQRVGKPQVVQRGEAALIAPTDTIETNISHSPDFVKAEADNEARYVATKTRLQNLVSSNDYPPLEIIDKLSKMLALPDDSDFPGSGNK